MGMCTAQGHYHTKFAIQYHSNPNHLLWALQVGCCFDPEYKAFAHAKKFKGRPVYGHAITINGLPKLLPMLLNKRGRWIGVVP